MLEPLTEEVALRALEWRKTCLDTLRTALPISEEEQRQWFRALPFRQSDMRYFQHITGKAMCGLTDIDWINGRAQISLIVDPESHRDGIGSECVFGLFMAAGKALRLHSLWAEVYETNPAMVFWESMNPYKICGPIPFTKFIDGKWYDSFIFTWIL